VLGAVVGQGLEFGGQIGHGEKRGKPQKSRRDVGYSRVAQWLKLTLRQS
jgi:hypothetical protein